MLLIVLSSPLTRPCASSPAAFLPAAGRPNPPAAEVLASTPADRAARPSWVVSCLVSWGLYYDFCGPQAVVCVKVESMVSGVGVRVRVSVRVLGCRMWYGVA
jgi:hypothetical protein